MSTLHLDDTERKKLAAKWLGITLLALHVWATILIVALIFGHPSAEVARVIATMFSTVTFGIGATLAILLIDRAADVVLNRFAVPAVPVAIEETTKRTITPAGTPPTETTVKDVNIKAEAVNVNQAE